VMVTNPDGTETAHPLSYYGITSINLDVTNASQITLPDGSSINGETTYTTSGGTSGTVAAVSLATGADGYVVTTTSGTNADGSVTVTNAVDNTDGSIAFTNLLNTSASSSTSDGVTTTTTDTVLSDVNNGGVVTTLETDDITSSTNGVTSETLTTYSGGTINLSTGELSGSGTSGAEKLSSTAAPSW
jgi:hypothetical protein